jgi:hypothetical protein
MAAEPSTISCHIAVIERLPHEVDIVTEGLTMALYDNEVVQQTNKDRERAKDMQSRRSHKISHAALAHSGRACATHFIAFSAR